MIHYPDYMLDPPEDTRKRVYSCAICDEDIMEGDDYYEIVSLGPCCEDCITDAKRFDAERECDIPDRREDF